MLFENVILFLIRTNTFLNQFSLKQNWAKILLFFKT